MKSPDIFLLLLHERTMQTKWEVTRNCTGETMNKSIHKVLSTAQSKTGKKLNCFQLTPKITN